MNAISAQQKRIRSAYYLVNGIGWLLLLSYKSSYCYNNWAIWILQKEAWEGKYEKSVYNHMQDQNNSKCGAMISLFKISLFPKIPGEGALQYQMDTGVRLTLPKPGAY